MLQLPEWAVPGVDYELAPGTYLRSIYYFSTKRFQIETPCTGWQHALVWFTKQAHIFCPYTGIHYNLPYNHLFISQSEKPKVTTERMLAFVKDKWNNQLQSVPNYIVKIIAPASFKPVEQVANRLSPSSDFKSVKRDSKRGRFLQKILDGCIYIPSIAEQLNMSRNNVLSYFYQMQKVNGIDYYLNKELDTVTLHMPSHEVWI